MREERKYWRNLPHIQPKSASFFATFCTKGGWVLPPKARDIVLKCCTYVHGRTAVLHGAVVMPDHVHMVLTPAPDAKGCMPTLEGIFKGIKGTAGLRINRLLGRHGPVWQAETFDHVLRRLESAEAKVDYIIQNPVRKGLVETPEDYRWLWRLSVHGTM